VVVPHLLSSGATSRATTALLFAVLVQFCVRLFRTLALVQHMQGVVGYIFGGAWWGFLLNFAAYCVAAHVSNAGLPRPTILLVPSTLHFASRVHQICSLLLLRKRVCFNGHHFQARSPLPQVACDFIQIHVL
jgi:hypothetical protein